MPVAEEIMDKMKQAVLTPFRLEQCLRIAESKYSGAVVVRDHLSVATDRVLFRVRGRHRGSQGSNSVPLCDRG